MHTPSVLGSIRKSDRHDVPELARLFATADLEMTPDPDEMLVLELDGSLRAAAQVVVGPELTRLQLLILDPSLPDDVRLEVEERMLGIVHALGTAYGSGDIVVSASP